MKKLSVVLALMLMLSVSAATAEGGVYLTTDQLPFDATAPNVPDYSLRSKDGDVTLKGPKVSDQDYDMIYAWYNVDGVGYFADFTYDAEKSAWVSDEVLTDEVALKDLTFFFIKNGTALQAQDHNFVGYNDVKNSYVVTESRRQYVYDGTSEPAKYDRAGNLVSYTVPLDMVDDSGNETMEATYTRAGNLRSAVVYDADGQRYEYNLGRWSTTKLDAAGNPVRDKDGRLVMVRSKAPKGYKVSELDQYKLTLIMPDAQWYPNNTVGVKGFALRDRYPGLTDKWYNVVPVDLTREGRQTFDLVASNLYLVGKAYVDISGSDLRVTYEYFESDRTEQLGETVALFTNVSQITREFLEEPTGDIQFGQTVSITNDLGGAKNALLFICNRLTYAQPYTSGGVMLMRYWPNHPRYTKYRAELETIMSKLEAAEFIDDAEPAEPVEETEAAEETPAP